MELEDLDLDGSWPLDQIALSSNLMMMSPATLVSSSEQPCSPLWAFSEACDDSGLSSAAGAAPHRFLDYPLSLACTRGLEAENATENDDNRKLPSPFWGSMPLENPDNYCMIKQKMTWALRYFKESTDQRVLAQVWAPVKDRGRYVLTTSRQPFVLDPNSKGLNLYRMVSLMYMFSLDGETDGELGLPGRVFRKKLPEWTPNVQYYSSREFSRLVHALHYNVQGTLALPVFEPSGRLCVGVVELIMTSQKINYAPEVDKVCKAFEAVDLKTSEILDHQTTQICNKGRQNALAEILEILTVICETHKLPLAQTWVPCKHRSVLAYGGGLKKSCSSFDGSCMGRVCMSTSDVSFYVVDAHMWGFREACVEHHLQKGQGVSGRAFLSRSLCFCRDVTDFCKTEYPLMHYARMFKLTSCFAICLQSSHTGDDDYVLEFFLPPAIMDKGEQDSLLGALLATMKPHFRSLKVASGMELGEDEASVEIIQASVDGTLYSRLEPIQIHHLTKSAQRFDASPNEAVNSPNKEILLDSNPINNKGDTGDLHKCYAPPSLPEVKDTKKSERKRGKTEKTISLEVLQQYFAGSLKDAAKSLGVCPTTMKRICRQHGISRWPSRKINKVNRSLTKLKHVIESVQGTDGTINLTSLTSSPLPVAAGSISQPSNLNTGYQQNSSSSKPQKSRAQNNNAPNCRSPGSCSQAVKNEQQAGSGSREESAGTPTSHVSSEGSHFEDNISASKPIVDFIQERCFTVGGDSPKMCFQPPIGPEPDLTSAFSVPGIFLRRKVQEPFEEMLGEDSSSSKDLNNPCLADAVIDEGFPESSWVHQTCNIIHPKEAMNMAQTKQEMKNISIKASYRADIIRFRISPSCGIMELKEEVARRLKLEVGTFDIKYLDDDHEWVSVSCDADLQECLDFSISSGCNTVRLSVHDVMPNFGSSCESTDALR